MNTEIKVEQYDENYNVKQSRYSVIADNSETDEISIKYEEIDVHIHEHGVKKEKNDTIVVKKDTDVNAIETSELTIKDEGEQASGTM